MANLDGFGIGTMTDGQFFRVLTEGIDRDGNVLFPLMGYPNLNRMTDEDLYWQLKRGEALAPTTTFDPACATGADIPIEQRDPREVVRIGIHDLRDFTTDKHRQVDDRPFGGLEGMVLKPEPVFRAVEAVRGPGRSKVFLLSPQGRTLDAAMARELAAERQVILICGRYEGVDERVAEHLVDGEISIGDYVLSGGELAAAVVVDGTGKFVTPGLIDTHVHSSWHVDPVVRVVPNQVAGERDPLVEDEVDPERQPLPDLVVDRAEVPHLVPGRAVEGRDIRGAETAAPHDGLRAAGVGETSVLEP